MMRRKKNCIIKTRQVPNDGANNSFKKRLHNIQDKIDALANKKSAPRFFGTDGPDSQNDKFINALVNCIEEDGPTTSNAHKNVMASTPHYTKGNKLFFNNNISLGMSPIEFQNSKQCFYETDQSETNESSCKTRRKLSKTHLATPLTSESSVIKKRNSNDPVARKNQYIEGGLTSPFNSRVSKRTNVLNDRANQSADAEEEIDNLENYKIVSKKIHSTNTRNINKSKKVETKTSSPEQNGTLVEDVDILEINAEKSLSDKESRVSKTVITREGRKGKRSRNTETMLEAVGHLDQDKIIDTTNTRHINKSKKVETKASSPKQNGTLVEDADILEVNAEKSLSDKESSVSKTLFGREDPKRKKLQNTEARPETMSHLDQDKTIHTTNTRQINKSKKVETKKKLPEEKETSVNDDGISEVNAETSLSDKVSRVSKTCFSKEDPKKRKRQNTEARLETVDHLDQDKIIQSSRANNDNSLISTEKDETANDPSSLDVLLNEIKEKVRNKALKIVNVQEGRRDTCAACSSVKPADIVRELRQRNANKLSVIKAVDRKTDPATRSERIIGKLMKHIAAAEIAKKNTKIVSLSDCDTSDVEFSVPRIRRRRMSRKSVMVQTSELHIQLGEKYQLERRLQRNTIARDDDVDTVSEPSTLGTTTAEDDDMETETSTFDDNSEVSSNSSRSSTIRYSNNRGISKIVDRLPIEPAKVKKKSYRSRCLRPRSLPPLPVFATESLHTVEQIKVGKDATICQTATTVCNRIANKNTSLLRRSSIRKGKRASRQLHVTVNSPTDGIRPNIFDSLKQEDSLDFAFEEYSDMYYSSNNTNAPWRFSGRSSQIPIEDRTNLNFLRSEAEILQANNSQEDAGCDTSGEHILPATTELPADRILRSYANRTKIIPNEVCEQSKAVSPSKRVSESSETRREAIPSSSDISDVEIDSSKTTDENISVDKSKINCHGNSQGTETKSLAGNVSAQSSNSSIVHIPNKPEKIVNKSLSNTQLTNSDATLDTGTTQRTSTRNRSQTEHAEELIIQNASSAEVTQERHLSDPEIESHIQSDNEYVLPCPDSFNNQNSKGTSAIKMANTESVNGLSDIEDQTSNRPLSSSRKSRSVRVFKGDVSVKNILPGRARRTRVPILQKLSEELVAQGYTLLNSPDGRCRRSSKKVSFMRKSKSIVNGRTSNKSVKNRIDEEELETQALVSIRETSVQENEENNLGTDVPSDVPTINADLTKNCSNIRATDSELMPPPKTTTLLRRPDSCNRNSEFESIHPPGHLSVVVERNIENNDRYDRGVSLSSNILSQTTENTGSRESAYETGDYNLIRRFNGQGDNSSSLLHPLSFRQLDSGCFHFTVNIVDDLLLNVGYIKILPDYCKPSANSCGHFAFYFVVSGRGEVQIENKKRSINQSDRFTVPKGVSYLIKNTSRTETLLLHYSLSKSDDHNGQ